MSKSEEDIRAGIVALLRANATLSAGLATFATKAAIFSKRPIPTECGRPYLIVDLINDVPDDSKDTLGRDIRYQVTVAVDSQPHSRSLVVSLAEAIRTALHRSESSLSATGFYITMVRVESIIDAVTSEHIDGKIVNVRVMTKET